MSSTAINILNGLSFGMILFLIAAGLSLILGVMNILNLAHGALFMIGGYVGWTVVDRGGGFWLGLLVAGLVVAAIGALLERGLLRRLHDQPDNQVLATLGVLYIATNATTWIWTAEPKVPVVPGAFDGRVEIVGTHYPVSRLALIACGALIAAGLWIFQERTRLGAMVRAGMEDRETAAGLGVNVSMVSGLVFAGGCFVVGASGVLGQQLVGLSPGQGTEMLLLALVVLVVGGVGTIHGALIGAMAIGLVNSFGSALFPSVSAFLVYGVMIVVLVVRPQGIAGRPSGVRS